MRLTVLSERYSFYIAWEDEDGIGAYLDQEGWQCAEPRDRDHWEHWVACKVAAESGAVSTGPGYSWETQSEAKKVAAQVRATIRAGRGLPEWAKTAAANGWKPPKGWKP
jgi:hypothetical protein